MLYSVATFSTPGTEIRLRRDVATSRGISVLLRLLQSALNTVLGHVRPSVEPSPGEARVDGHADGHALQIEPSDDQIRPPVAACSPTGVRSCPTGRNHERTVQCRTPNRPRRSRNHRNHDHRSQTPINRVSARTVHQRLGQGPAALQ